MNKGESGLSALQNKNESRVCRPPQCGPTFICVSPLPCCQIFFRGTKTIMTKLRLVLLATTAMTAMQFVSAPSHAQTAPLVMAQAQPNPELGPDGKPKPPPKGAPPKAAPPPAHPAPPAAAPPRPAPPPPPAAAPPRPTPPPPPAAAPPPDPRRPRRRLRSAPHRRQHRPRTLRRLRPHRHILCHHRIPCRRRPRQPRPRLLRRSRRRRPVPLRPCSLKRSRRCSLKSSMSRRLRHLPVRRLPAAQAKESICVTDRRERPSAECRTRCDAKRCTGSERCTGSTGARWHG